MQDRAQANQDDVGSLKSPKAYSVIAALRTAVDMSVYGLNVGDLITKASALITVVVVEGFCTFLSGAITVHEIVQVSLEQCCRRDGRTVASTSHTPVQYSLYLSFRVLSVAVSAVGVGLAGSQIGIPTLSEKAAIGLVMIGLGNATNSILNGLTYKPADVVLLSEAEEMEMGLRKARLAQMRRGILQAVPAEPAAAVAATRSAAQTTQPNPFFQPLEEVQIGRAPAPAPAPQDPAAMAAVHAKRLTKKKRYGHKATPAKTQPSANDVLVSDDITLNHLTRI